MQQVRSRILEFFPEEVLLELNKIKSSVRIYNNNEKIKVALKLLDDYNVPYIKIGTGTNRLAILTDNYIFKIAMDDEGIRDNRNEFVLSQKLQPNVLRAYETNSLITVYEYVTLISMEEFKMRGNEILAILEKLSQEYLFGDIGFISKNFQNWGYRDDGSLVILDYAYMYRIYAHTISCSKCGKSLYYTRDYASLECPNCRAKYLFWDIRKRLDMNVIDSKIQDELDNSIRVTEKVTLIDDRTFNIAKFSEDKEDDGSILYNKNRREEGLRDMKNKFGVKSYTKDPWSEDAYGDGKYDSYDNLMKFVNDSSNEDDEDDYKDFSEKLEDHKNRKKNRNEFSDFVARMTARNYMEENVDHMSDDLEDDNRKLSEKIKPRPINKSNKYNSNNSNDSNKNKKGYFIDKNNRTYKEPVKLEESKPVEIKPTVEEKSKEVIKEDTQVKFIPPEPKEDNKYEVYEAKYGRGGFFKKSRNKNKNQ